MKVGQLNLRLITEIELYNKNFKELNYIPTATIIVSIPAVPYGENDLYYKLFLRY